MSRLELNKPPAITTDTFKYLEQGTPFMLVGGLNVYIKTEEVSKSGDGYQKRDYNTVCLDDGGLYWTDVNREVVIVTAKITVSYDSKESENE